MIMPMRGRRIAFAAAVLLALSVAAPCAAQDSSAPPPGPAVAADPALEAARHDAEAARAEAQKAQAAAVRAQHNSKIEKKKREAAVKAAELAREAASAAQKRLDALQKRSKGALDAKAREAAKAAADAALQKQRMIWGGAAAAVLLVLVAIAAALLLGRSRKRRLKAEGQAEAAQRVITPLPGASDLLFEGMADGQKIALKIPAVALNPETGGAVIGRNPREAAFVINRAELSRRHCKLYVAGGQMMVEDLDSTNGTFVNGQRVVGAAVALNEADTLGLANLTLSVKKVHA